MGFNQREGKSRKSTGGTSNISHGLVPLSVPVSRALAGAANLNGMQLLLTLLITPVLLLL